MDRLSFPPHVKSNDCSPCRKFAFRPVPCTHCSDGHLHVLRKFKDGITGEIRLDMPLKN